MILNIPSLGKSGVVPPPLKRRFLVAVSQEWGSPFTWIVLM